MECTDCKHREVAKGRKICLNCKNRRYENKYPIIVAYHRLKGHAKARNKVFTISLEYFTQFCVEVDYIAKRGTSKTSYHIDRVIEELGYIEGNLQLLLNPDNVKKYKRWKCLNENGQSEFEVITIKPLEKDEDSPF